ncbi:MAG: serine/threonine protein kinase, partial [Planctomycetes bacterium]|nr:serine/threonine protein kinase [Planctomycetota bacterium]
GLASEPAVRAALAEQERELALGRTPDRLGEILVKRGHIRPEAVLRALARQNKLIMRCSGCGTRFNVWALPAGTVTGGAAAAPSPAVPGAAADAASLPSSSPPPRPDTRRARRSASPTPRPRRIPPCPDCGQALVPAPTLEDQVVAADETVEVTLESDADGGTAPAPGAGDDADPERAVLALARLRPAPDPDASSRFRALPCFETDPKDPSRGRFGRYEILRPIERGGLSFVCRARDPVAGDLVALKILRDPERAGPDGRARFLREARVLGLLAHPHVVAAREAGERLGYPYFAMGWIDGPRLDRVVAGGRPLADRAAALVVRALADAIAHVHARGLVHRDLKPGNVLLRGVATPGPPTAPGARAAPAQPLFPVIVDFGEACSVAGGEIPGADPCEIVGTPAYMAPEEAQGREDAVGPLLDVYALGAILYQMLTGLPPFQGDSPSGIMSQVAALEPPRASALNPRADMRLEAICRMAMARNPAARYDSAAALRHTLDRWLADHPEPAGSE